jgi:hypothetical protein
MGCLIMTGVLVLVALRHGCGLPLLNNRSGQYPSMFLDNLLPLHFSSVALDGFIHGFYLIYYTTFVHDIHAFFKDSFSHFWGDVDGFGFVGF